MFIGSLVFGPVLDMYRIEGAVPHDWSRIWLVPAIAAAVVLVLFALFFREREEPQEVGVRAVKAQV